jgi:hypothetical protein
MLNTLVGGDDSNFARTRPSGVHLDNDCSVVLQTFDEFPTSFVWPIAGFEAVRIQSSND